MQTKYRLISDKDRTIVRESKPNTDFTEHRMLDLAANMAWNPDELFEDVNHEDMVVQEMWQRPDEGWRITHQWRIGLTDDADTVQIKKEF